MSTTATTSTGAKRVAPKTGGLARSRRNEAIGLVIPTLIPILALSVVPLFIGVATAFTDSRLARNHETQFIGFENFIKLGSDTQFWKSFGIGVIWAVVGDRAPADRWTLPRAAAEHGSAVPRSRTACWRSSLGRCHR